MATPTHTEKSISDAVRTAYVNNVLVTAKEIQESLRSEGREVKRPSISRILRKCRETERGYKNDGIIGETFSKPESLRSYEPQGVLTFAEKVLLSASIVVGIVLIAVEIWK